MAKKDIIQELIEFESRLAGTISQPIYAVPEGYFDGFAAQVLLRIKATNAADATEELAHLSPILSKLSKELPYSVPQGYFDGVAVQSLSHTKALNAVNAAEELAYLSPILNTISKELPYSAPHGYFDGLADSLIDNLRTLEDYQTADEELESLSPLLSSISKKAPYSVPDGYFENFQISINPVEKQQAKVIPINNHGNRKWFRYAAAAAIVGVIALGAMLFFRPAKTVDVSNTHAWVEQNMKKVSTNDINSFIQQTNEANAQNQAITASVKNDDINEIMKDVSDNDIQKFLNETEISEEGSDDLFLN